jgi:hypothetical protein
MNGVFANYVLKRIWPKGVNADTYFESCDFSRENTNIVNYRLQMLTNPLLVEGNHLPLRPALFLQNMILNCPVRW